MTTRSRRGRTTAQGNPVKNPDTVNVADLLHVHYESDWGFHTVRFVVGEISRIGKNQYFYASARVRTDHRRLVVTHSHRGFIADGYAAEVTNYGTTINQSPTLPGMEN